MKLQQRLRKLELKDMKPKKIRVVIDTNLWISFLISKEYRKIDTLFLSKKMIILFSNELINEFLAVVNRPKLRKHFNRDNIEKLMILFNEFGEIIKVHSKVEKCRDPKDNFLLELAKDGKADYLITGDSDLLVLREFSGTNIFTIKEFEIKELKNDD